MNCAEPGATYEVNNHGQMQYWSWWAHVTDDTWIPTATLLEVSADGQPAGVANC